MDTHNRHNKDAFDSLAKTFLRVWRNLSRGNEKFTIDNISKTLANDQQLHVFLNHDDQPEPDSKGGSLQERLDQLQNDREQFVRQLQELQQEASQKNDNMRQALTTALNLAGIQSTPRIRDNIETVRETLVNDYRPDDSYEALQRLNVEVSRLNNGRSSASSVPGTAEDPGEDAPIHLPSVNIDCLAEVKEVYLECLRLIDFDLGDDYLDQLEDLKGAIAGKATCLPFWRTAGISGPSPGNTVNMCST